MSRQLKINIELSVPVKEILNELKLSDTISDKDLIKIAKSYLIHYCSQTKFKDNFHLKTIKMINTTGVKNETENTESQVGA